MKAICFLRAATATIILLLSLCAVGLGASSKATRPAQTKPAASPPSSQPAEKAHAVKLTATSELKKKVIAHIRISGEIPDSPPSFSLLGEENEQMTLRDWLERLAKARNDPSVAAVALEIDSPEITWAQAQELADAVSRLRAVKPVHAFMFSGDASDFLIASAASDLTMDPAGTLEITGLAGEMLFFRGSLDFLGIHPQFVQIGRFKGASEPWTATQPSADWLETENSLMDDLYAQLCEQIARQRKLKRKQVEAAIDAGPLSAQQAMKFHLTDRLSEELDWEDFVSHEIVTDGEIDWVSHYGKKEKKGIDFTNPFAILKSLTAPKTDEIVDPTIAIIHANGLIVPGSGNEGLFSEPMVGQRTLTTCLLKVADDDRIKAVVLRINSPGGSAEASESIYQAVRYCADQKPVIVSVSQMAASGGYYIAAGATKIIADPAAITGSIGVVCGKLAYSDLLGKLKIGRHELTRGKNAGMWLSRPWNPHEEELVRKLAERTYDTFVRRVAQSRAGKIKNIDSVAQGRVFTARQALDKGLIDDIGGFREALAAAQGATKVERCRFINLPRPRTLMDLLSGTSEDDDEETLAPLLSSRPEAFLLLRQAYGGSLPLAQNGGLSYLLKLASLLGREKVLTAMPYYLVVKP